MSNRCGFCDTKTETDMLVLGNQWLEFCSPCGETETLNNAETGEVASIKAVFDNIADGSPIVSQPAPVSVIEGVELNGQPIDAHLDDWDDSMDGDHESALASAGLGTDEDYGFFGDDWD